MTHSTFNLGWDLYWN